MSRRGVQRWRATGFKVQTLLDAYPLARDLASPALHPWGVLAAVLRSPSRFLDGLTTTHHRYLDLATAAVTQNPLIFPRGFFCDGWGDLHTPERLTELVQSHRMNEVKELRKEDMHWKPKRTMRSAGVSIQEATFKSTVPNAEAILPEESVNAHCELVTPLEETQQDRPLVVLLPGTGEHGFVHRRVSLAIPLAKRGISTLILEGPFYGKRKPRNQQGSKLRRVSDLPILGQATIEESKSLLTYFNKHQNFSRLVVAGCSMGGLHAAMTASVYPGDVGATAWLAPPSAVPVFADGLLAASCSWSALYRQHESEILDKMLQGSAVASGSYVESEDRLQQAKKHMRHFLSVTDIDNFHAPNRADAVVFVIGTEDQYIGWTEEQWKRLQEKWYPASFRAVPAGHVSGILLEQEKFCKTVEEVVGRLGSTEAEDQVA